MFAYAAILLAGFSAPHVAAVQPSDLAFGREQVEQFIHDRPDAGAVINGHPALKEQLALLFADDGQGVDGQVEHVHWDNREPAVSSAEHYASREDHPTWVRVTKNSAYSAIDKSSMLVFELHNAQNDRNFNALESNVIEKRISREDYARSIVQGEFEADKKTKEFFLRYPLGDVKSNHDPQYAYILGLPADFSDYLKRSKVDLFQFYREQYDQIVFRESDPDKIATSASFRDALIASDQSSIFIRHLKTDSSETADDDASDSPPTRIISPHAWGDGLDWTLTVAFFASIVLVLVVGYCSMGLHIRDYLRSLRRALVVLGHYSRELPKWILRDRPRCIQALGLTLPCTASEVLTAYRKKVELVHPDRGGDPRDFLRLQEHFEQAMALAGD